MSRPGWIKLYNQTLDSDFWIGNNDPFDWRSAFFHVLLSANWKQGVFRKNGHTIVIERGQLLTSTRKLASTFHWSRKRVENWLKGMKMYGMITSKSVYLGTVLTVVNYDKFQLSGATGVATEVASDVATGVATEELRSKTIDRRSKTVNPAHADPPPEESIGPPQGSAEWYALHNDD